MSICWWLYGVQGTLLSPIPVFTLWRVRRSHCSNPQRVLGRGSGLLALPWCLVMSVCLSVSTTSPFSFLPVCLSPKELSLNPWRRSKYGEATLVEGHGLGGIFGLHGPLQPHLGEIP